MLLVSLFALPVLAQLGMGGTPHPSAALDVQSSNKAFYAPRMTTAQRKAIVNPQAGALVFDTDKEAFFFFDGQYWLPLTLAPSTTFLTIDRTASDGEMGDYFGTSVAISGDYAVVGTHQDDVGANANQGSAYVFMRSGGAWVQQTKLVASDGAAEDNFGWSVAISGDYVLVGALTDVVLGNSQRGSAYVFVRSGATWTQQAKLIASDGAAQNQFGWSVAISGVSALVGAIGANATPGAAYKSGIETVWKRASQNAFYRGVPFTWCSNNLTTSFATQCFWYRQLTNDDQFAALEQANFDWLFGCNPWGTSFVYGLPANTDTPADPHSAFTHLKNYPIDGGLVDGPVRGSIYGNLIDITLHEPDEYAPFQSKVAVYHDDYGDYSTNEPTMDGTASLVYLLAAKHAEKPGPVRKTRTAPKATYFKGAKIRGDTTARRLSLVFTGDEFADGGSTIARTLQKHQVRASFFLTGRFLRNPAFTVLIN